MCFDDSVCILDEMYGLYYEKNEYVELTSYRIHIPTLLFVLR